MKSLIFSTFILSFMFPLISQGQYYDWGQSPASIKWYSIEDSAMRIVYPDYFGPKAQNTLNYFSATRPFISHGYTKGPMKVPVTLHTQNSNPNGIVMLAPRRMELITNPTSSGYATPWLKQLAVHEYRHAVQFNNLNTGVIKVLRYLLGEQGWMLGSWGLPLWMMEGDAVMAETQFTSFGRALQPSFTLEYRAMHGQGVPRYHVDKYFSGSYKDHIPDHYQLGYQLISYAYEQYDESLTNNIGRFWARNPYLIFTTNIGLKKFYGTNEKTLVNQTFDALESHWDKLPQGLNDFEIIDNTAKSHTTYKSPILLGDSLIYAIKSDFDRSNRITMIDPDKKSEQTLAHIGYINTPLIFSEGKLYWTELRSSTFWEQRINSILCSYDLKTGKKKSYTDHKNILFPTSTGTRSLAYASYSYDGVYSVHSSSGKINLPDSISLHALAGDSHTGRLFMIALSDAGMWIGEIDETGFIQLTPPSRTTIDKLTASHGKLFYGSIATGKDEIHVFDLLSEQEYRLTDSRYGSFSPTANHDGSRVAFATYVDSKRGYSVATKKLDIDSLEKVDFSHLPHNIVNPERKRWNLFNIDSVATDYTQETPINKPRRYRKAAHLINIHSWAPVYFEPDKVLEDFQLNLQFGATLISQNLLSSTMAQAGYGYSSSGGHMVSASFKYYGWAPKFELSGTWGGGNRSTFGFAVPGGTQLPQPDISKRYFNIALTTYLPVTFDNGYHVRRFVPSLELSHNNGLLLKSDMTGYHSGYQRLIVSAYFSDNVRMSYRDFLPRFGYMLRGSYVSAPFSSDFGEILSAFGRIYLPGLAVHHSLMLRGVTQYQTKGLYNFSRKELYPRGMSYTLIARNTNVVSVDYQLPLGYPDWGINSLLFLKRVRINLGYDYAHFNLFNKTTYSTNSFGGDINIDLTVNRMPASATSTLKLSIFKSSHERVYIGAGLSLPI